MYRERTEETYFFLGVPTSTFERLQSLTRRNGEVGRTGSLRTCALCTVLPTFVPTDSGLLQCRLSLPVEGLSTPTLRWDSVRSSGVEDDGNGGPVTYHVPRGDTRVGGRRRSRDDFGHTTSGFESSRSRRVPRVRETSVTIFVTCGRDTVPTPSH